MDPQNVADINVVGKGGAHPEGAIYMTWKKPHPVFLSLKQISDTEKGLTGKSILYVIDDSLIRDTSLVRIEAANVYSVHSITSSEAGYLPKNTDPFSVVLVQTRSSFQKKPQQPGAVTWHIH